MPGGLLNQSLKVLQYVQCYRVRFAIAPPWCPSKKSLLTVNGCWPRV